jgi:hypothetical protein
MQGKFIVGIVLGTLIGVAAVLGGGAYYLYQSGASSPSGVPANAPKVEIGKSDRVSQLLTPTPRLAGEPGLAEVRIAPKLPAQLLAKLPAEFSASLQIMGLSKSGSFIEPTAVPLIAKRSLDFSVNPSEMPEGDLRFTLLLCPSRGSRICDGNEAIFSTRTWAQFDRNKKLVDLGEVPVSRFMPPPENCQQNLLLAGTIVPTDAYLKTAKPGPKALVLISVKQSPRNAPILARSTVDGELGNNVIYFKYDGPAENQIKAATLFEPKKGGVAFSLPAGQSSDFVYLPLVVDCKPGEDAKTCARNAFPLPANVSAIPGRVTKLVAKDFLTPRCGTKDLTLYLHDYNRPGKGTPDSSLPPEIYEGASNF